MNIIMNVIGMYFEINKCLENIGIGEIIKSPPLFLIFIEFKHEIFILFLGFLTFSMG